MNRTIVFLVLLAVLISAAACKKETTAPDELVPYDDGGHWVATYYGKPLSFYNYSYDDQGNLIKETWNAYQEGAGWHTQVFDYIWEDGLIVEESSFFDEKGKSIYYKYNSDRQLIERLTVKHDSPMDTASERYVWFSDSTFAYLNGNGIIYTVRDHIIVAQNGGDYPPAAKFGWRNPQWQDLGNLIVSYYYYLPANYADGMKILEAEGNRPLTIQYFFDHNNNPVDDNIATCVWKKIE